MASLGGRLLLPLRLIIDTSETWSHVAIQYGTVIELGARRCGESCQFGKGLLFLYIFQTNLVDTSNAFKEVMARSHYTGPGLGLGAGPETGPGKGTLSPIVPIPFPVLVPWPFPFSMNVP